MNRTEIARMLFNNITLIEYEDINNKSTFFIQLGVVGFYTTEAELGDLYSLLSYYHNIETVNDTVISYREQ